MVPAPPSPAALPFGRGNPAPGVFASLRSAFEALEALRALPKELRRRIGQKIDALQTDLQGDVKKLGG